MVTAATFCLGYGFPLVPLIRYTTYVLPVLILVQSAVFIYSLVTILIPLGNFSRAKITPWPMRLPEALLNGILLGVPIILTASGYKEAIILYFVLLVGDYLSWWHPYLFGPSAIWRDHYDRYYAHTILAPLPRLRDHPTPNIEHLILHFSTLVAFLLTWKYFF